MTILLIILKRVLAIIPFITLCLACKKINLPKANRARQFLIPPISFLYTIVCMFFLSGINIILYGIMLFLSLFIPILNTIDIGFWMPFVLNTALITVFMSLKGVMLPVLNKIWDKSKFLMELTSGKFYTYDEEFDKWFLDNKYGQLRTFISGFYYASLSASTLLFLLATFFPFLPFFKIAFYPVLGVLALGEIVSYFSGMTRSEFVENILGEDEEAYHVVNYGTLRDKYRKLFDDKILYDETIDNSNIMLSSFDSLDKLIESESLMERTVGSYYSVLKMQGEEIDTSYLKSSMNLLNGQSVLFCNPFYHDLTSYIILPMIKKLLQYQKCLIVVGRDSVTEDVKKWITKGITDFTSTPELMKTEVLSSQCKECDIGILRFCDLHNLNLIDNYSSFFENVGFVILIEPSRILATGQLGLSLIVSKFNPTHKKIVYCACDRNCDGLIDSLSHLLKANMTEVNASAASTGTSSQIYWDARGPGMHLKIMPNISRYLGSGTEIAAVALKHQVSKVYWLSSEKFPVIDMKWILGQYYKQICSYANLPATQESLNEVFFVDSNLWNYDIRDHAFIIIEDEFQNLFETTRLFSSRAKHQSFLNIICEDYLLRDYMIDNVRIFMNDPKAIPTIVPDYARTERNTILRILMMMYETPILENTIAKEFMVSGIVFKDTYTTLIQLIDKHCKVEDLSIKVILRDELANNTLQSEIRKYFIVEKGTKIAEYTKRLTNAYYLAEDDKDESNYIGAKLYGHVFQTLLPGQFLTYAGKYYEVQTITPENGVVVRRAADYITSRKYYRQIRDISLSNWQADQAMASIRTISGIEINKGFCDIAISTGGYYEMSSYGNIKDAKKVTLNGIPDREYKNKTIMKINLPAADENIRYTICILLNEIFKTTYPESYQYICASMFVSENINSDISKLMYKLNYDWEDTCIYIIEDSEIDLGLIVSIDRNIDRYFGIINEILNWREVKMKEEDQVDEIPETFIPRFMPQKEKTGSAKSLLARILDFLKRLFKIKKKPIADIKDIDVQKPNPIPQTEVVEGLVPTQENEQQAEGTDPEELPVDEMAQVEVTKPEELPVDERTQVEGTEPEELSEDEFVHHTRNVFNEIVAQNELEEKASEEMDADIIGEDEILVADEKSKKTAYQKSNYFYFGYECVDNALDLKGTVDYLDKFGYGSNPLKQTRETPINTELIENTYDPKKEGAHFCDFCGTGLAGGEYDVLKDGRERCNQCSNSALRTGKEFKEIFKSTMRNMEIFYMIKVNTAITVRMTDARKVAKQLNSKFDATPGFDGRVLGFAKKDKNGYTIYIENGSPKIAAIATIAHELTHIWQYQNWDSKVINSTYGKANTLEVYEGMAKWVEINYLIKINECSYAKRQEIVTKLRDDEYGHGLINYLQKYPMNYNSKIKTITPFQENPPL